MPSFLKIFLFLIVIILIYGSVNLYQNIKKSQELTRNAEKFEQINPSGKPRILVLGDSTAFGAGASRPAKSIAGLFGADFPAAHVENLAINGLRANGLLKFFDDLNYPEKSFDLILIQIGANDILGLTNLESLEKDVSGILDRAKTIGKNVAVLHSGNIGIAPFFPKSIGWLFTDRTRKVREIYLKLAEEKDAVYVDLFHERKDDPFAKEPRKYYAPDFLHLSDEGNKVWYNEIRKAMASKGITI